MTDQTQKQRYWLFAAVIVIAVATALIFNALRDDSPTPPAAESPAVTTTPPASTPEQSPATVPPPVTEQSPTAVATPTPDTPAASTQPAAGTVGQDPTGSSPATTHGEQTPIGTTMIDGKPNYIYPAATADGPSSTTTATSAATPAEQAAETVATRWLTAVCGWTYTQPLNSNLRAATQYSISGKPLTAPAWQITKTDWPTIAANKMASTCHDITAHVDHGNQSAHAPTTLAMIITATQTLTQGTVTYQTQPVEEVRLLTLTPTGWRVGPPTAAA